MEPIVSCCGVICSECPRCPQSCAGCPAIRGRVFWLSYTGDPVCPIYGCCVEEKDWPHCGAYPQLPCSHYALDDPTKSAEENAEDHRRQMEQLRRMAADTKGT